MALSAREPRSRRPWILLTVAALGIVMSIVLARHLALREHALFDAEFEQRARERAVAIENTLQDNLSRVQSIVALFNASREVERDEFRVFARSILSDGRHALQALSFDPVVPAERRREHERRMRAEGFGEYGITEMDAAGRPVPAGKRKSYVVVSFLEPLEGNEAALGFDVASEPARREALTRARDQGQATVTAPLRLVQHSGENNGALIFAPVFASGGIPADVEERRKRLRGFAAGVLRLDQVVERALAGLGRIDLDIRVEDLSAPPETSLLYPGSGGIAPAEAGDEATRTYQFSFAGRYWRVVETTTPAYRSTATTWGPPGVAMVGLLATMLIVGYLYWQGRANDRLRRAIRERERAEERRAGFGRLLDEAHDEIYVFDAETLRFIHVNEGALRNLGYSMDELRRMTPLDLKPEISPEAFQRLLKPLRLDQRNRVQFNTVHRRKDGSRYDVEVHLQLGTFDGNPAVVAVLLDVTERKALEERLRQFQRLEALGTLAGGIAHDFNNLLTSIVGYTELALAELPAEGPTRGRLTEVLKASERAREVVRRILAFSRRGDIESRTFDLREPVRDALQLVRVSLPPTIEVHAELNGPCPIDGDPGQIHQVLMNLFTNAAHAMREGGGTLDVRLRRVALGTGEAAAGELEPGEYSRISVRDTGHGIAPEIIDQIFDPFFTTKEPGEGTGMGLAVAHGIVRSHGGTLTVSSTPGNGSAFEILLPRSAAAFAETEERVEEASGGRESILVVDDEPGIASLLKEVLERQGYRVVAKSDSLAALETFRNAPQSFDLVITDFAMPGLTGGQLAHEMARIAPRLPVILVSGHGDLLDHEGTEGTGIRLSLTKPVTFRELATAVRRVLDTG